MKFNNNFHTEHYFTNNNTKIYFVNKCLDSILSN